MAEFGIPYTLETPRGTLRFNTADENGDMLRLDAVDGLDHPVLRSAVVNRPQAAGAIVFPSIDGARYPILIGKIRVVESAEAAMLARRRELEDKLRSWAGSLKTGPGVLRWQPNGAPWRRLATVQLIDRVQISGGVIKDFMLALIAADPVVYSDSEYVASTDALAPGVGAFTFPFSFPVGFGSATSGGNGTIRNGGDEPSWPTVRIYGPVTGPRIANLTSGYEVALPGLAVTGGDYAEVSMRNETVFLNGSTDVSLSGSLNIPASVFWPLELGDNAVQLSADGYTGAAYASIVYRHAFG